MNKRFFALYLMIIVLCVNSPLNTLSQSTDITNEPPTIVFINPKGGETLSGAQEISWFAFDSENDDLSFNLFISPELSSIWTNLVSNYSLTSYVWDTLTVPDGRYFLKLIASDAVSSSVIQIPIPITVLNELPYDNDLILPGIPYPIFNLQTGENTSFYIELQFNETYSFFVFGDYLNKNVDLSIYLFQNGSQITRELLENSPRSLTHSPGNADMFTFSPNETLIFQIYIENDYRYSTTSAEGKLLVLEHWNQNLESSSLDSYPNKKFSLNATGLKVSSKTDFKAFLLQPFKQTDSKITITLTPSLSLQTELSLYPLFNLKDLKSFLPLDQNVNPTVYKRADSEGEQLSIDYKLSDIKSSLNISGIIIFIQALTGSGDVNLSVKGETFYSIDTINPPSIPIWFSLDAGQNLDFHFLLEANFAYTFFLELPVISSEGWNLFLYNYTSTSEIASIAEFSKNGTKLTIEKNIIKETGRYILKVIRDNSTKSNSTSEFAWLFVSERLPKIIPNENIIFTLERGELNSTPTLRTFRSLIIPVSEYYGLKLSVNIIPTSNLRIFALLHAFTTTLDRISFNNSKYDPNLLIDSESGKVKGDQISLSFQRIGFRGYERINEEFVILVLVADWGEGAVEISISTSSSSEDWFRIILFIGLLTGSFLSLALVIIIEKRF